MQKSCSQTVAEQQDANDATAAFPTPLTAEFDTEKKEQTQTAMRDVRGGGVGWGGVGTETRTLERGAA